MDQDTPKPLTAFTTSFTLSSMASATMGLPANLVSTASFTQYGEEELSATVNFPRKQDLKASATFFLALSQNLLVSVSLGTHKKTLPLLVNFRADGQTHFQSKITIQSLNITQAGNYGGVSQFKAAIKIQALGFSNFSGKVNFRQPPINQDLIGSVNFINTFAITATDNFGNIFPGTIDSTGYFVINNLEMGNYTVIPSLTNLVFTPYQIFVQIDSSNEFIYFNASNTSFLNSYAINVPQGYINSNQGAAGTYSIEGFILPKNNNYQAILSIITNPTIEANYKQTLNLTSYGGI